MKTFKLSSHITISAYTEVEAETIEDAIEIANSKPNMSLPYQNYYKPDEYWIIDEIDGEPVNIQEIEE